MLNFVLFVHALLAFGIAGLAIIWPDLLVQIGTFASGSSLNPEGALLCRAFGVCLFLVGALAWGARISPSKPTRRLTTLLFMLHLLLGGVVAILYLILLPGILTYTIWLMLIACLVLFGVYFYIWLFLTTDF